MQEIRNKPMHTAHKAGWKNVAGILLVVAISLAALGFRDALRRWAAYGYFGLFLITLVSNASVILPLPGLVLPFTLGAVLHPFWVAIVAALAATLGELSGYVLGLSGRAFIEDYALYGRLKALMARYGVWMLFAAAVIPLPVFDIVGILAGMTRIPMPQFLFWVFLGKLVKMLAVTYFGGWLLPWLGIE